MTVDLDRLAADLSQHTHHQIGSLRVAMDEVRAIVEALAELRQLRAERDAMLTRFTAYAHMFGRAIATFRLFAALAEAVEQPSLKSVADNAAKGAEADLAEIRKQDEWIEARAALGGEHGK